MEKRFLDSFSLFKALFKLDRSETVFNIELVVKIIFTFSLIVNFLHVPSASTHPFTLLHRATKGLQDCPTI